LTLLADNRTREKPFELVILDWLMPELDGIETARRIRTDLKLALPIILMTAFGKENERQDAQKAGINAFLTKPIYPSTLFNAIMDAFGKARVAGGSVASGDHDHGLDVQKTPQGTPRSGGGG
jgi:two-component system sensor histidine kinase/response regulator